MSVIHLVQVLLPWNHITLSVIFPFQFTFKSLLSYFLSACFCNQHPVDLLLQCFLSSCFPKGLQRSCLKALSPLQIVPSTIWRNAISLGNGCRCPFDKISVPSVFQKSYESDFVKIKKPTQFQLLQKSKIHRLIPLTWSVIIHFFWLAHTVHF